MLATVMHDVSWCGRAALGQARQVIAAVEFRPPNPDWDTHRHAISLRSRIVCTHGACIAPVVTSRTCGLHSPNTGTNSTLYLASA